MILCPSSDGTQPAPVPPGAGLFLGAGRDRAVVLDSLLALEEQLHGAAMMPPLNDVALESRIAEVAWLVGSSVEQIVQHWLYWARSK